MQDRKSGLTLVVLVATLITLSTLRPLPTALAQTESITRPAVSESASPLQEIAPVAQDGHRGDGILRKPPGEGPFPAVVLIHPGLEMWPSKLLRQYASAGPLASRFLAAGYVVATMTYRSRDLDPQTRVSLDDSLAAVDHVQKLPFVNPASVAVYGCSGGGDLALAVAAEKSVAAIASEEPASILFTGLFDKTLPKAGERYTPMDSAPLFKDFKRYYTDDRQKLTRAKVARIQSPILIVQGDVKTPLAVNDFNAAVLIPELQAARKSVQVITYPGQPHCFAFAGAIVPGASHASAAKAFQDMDAFFRRHLATQPKALDPMFVTQVPLTNQ